ncbi:MAG: alpha/beta hydrolase, partial [Tolypothrix sp. Co-bin9]|nr:alpha/beta hydrolase [Tolypothrix sp. Co-bin9]
MQFQLLVRNRRKIAFAQKLLCSLSLAFGLGVGMPSTLAAQRIIIRLGPFEQSVAIADLEKYAKTGKLPEKLEILSPLLSPEVQNLLTRRLQVDPALADKFIADLVRTPEGQRLIASLGVAIPGSTVESLQGTLNLALRQFNGLSALGFLRAYPQSDVTVDATQAIGLAAEFSANRLQSQALGVLLARELAVDNNIPFRATFDRAARGKVTVDQDTLTFADRQRYRIIPVDIYSSRSEAQAPLVVISHGFGANRKFSEYLARHFASHGITVAAIEHPG